MHFPLADTFFGLTAPQLAGIIGLMALLFSVLRWRRNMIDKQRRTPPRPVDGAREVQSPLAVHEIASEIHALVTDLEETARRVTAQIDNRYTRLEQLMGEADEKIRQLEAASSQSKPGPARIIGEKPAAVVSEAQRTLSRLRAERGAPAPADDPAYQPIYALADRGKNAREIAQELKRHQGEIELILALRQRQATA